MMQTAARTSGRLKLFRQTGNCWAGIVSIDIIQSIDLIATNPQVRGGSPYIVGTTVTVADIATVKIYHGQDVDGLAVWFGLTLAQVHAALAYYYQHRDVLDEQIRTRIRRSEALAEKRIGSENSLLP